MTTLWYAPTATAQDSQAIARLMLEQIEGCVEGSSEHVEITCD